MSPFARQLNELWLRHGIRQNELAELIGYNQTHISALEVGLKGPPTPEFVDKVVATLPLTPAKQEELRTVAKASDRKLCSILMRTPMCTGCSTPYANA
jgi:transcriptional regulator with XRE-family HTH domain